MRIDIWTDINCPFCYLGKARFEQALTGFDHRDTVEVVHRSFELDPSAPADTSVEVVPMIAAKYGISIDQAAANDRALAAQAAELGLDYLTDGRDSGSSFDMHRLLHLARTTGHQNALVDALYAANFADDRPLFGNPNRLAAVAATAGLDSTRVREVLDNPDVYADAVRADEQEATRLGITGVPFFVIDGKYAVSGAQPTEVFTEALNRAWNDRPTLEPVGTGAEACGPDGCAVPGASPTD